jgi:xylulokinase
LIADVTGKAVQRCATPEASALGAGILAAVGSGLYPNVAAAAAAMTRLESLAFTPNAERHAVYSLLYEDVYRRLFPALQPALRRLADLQANLSPATSNQSGELDTNP